MADIDMRAVAGERGIEAGRSDLVAKLDELLERYLHTLDTYQKAREELAKELSSGFFSLAQANFTNSTYARYGQDFYDERMQALRSVAVIEEDDNITLSIQTAPSPAPGEGHDGAKASPPETDTAGSDSIESSTLATKKSAPRDPLKWFGILVPPALRSAQTSFVAAVEGPVPHILVLAKDLRRQEIEIGRLRKQIKRL